MRNSFGFRQLSRANIILTTVRDHPVSATNAIVRHSMIFLFSIIIFLSSGCNFLYRNGLPVPDQTVSGPITIGSEWVEIIPPKPLKAYDVLQSINLGYHEYSKTSEFTFDAKGETLTLEDGRKTKIEAILYDDRGEGYELQITSLGSGVGFSRKYITKTMDNEETTISPDFPTDRTYTKLRMRSEMPLKCEFIKWTGHINF